jgi:hypothetical protein
MFVSADQIVSHLVGDYLLQSDWMAENKTKSFKVACVHAFFYTLPFLLFRPSHAAIAVIIGTHVFIDHYRLARYVVWLKNWIGPRWLWAEYKTEINGWQLYHGGFEGEDHGPIHRGATPPFSACRATGYPPDRPAWLTVWLLIIADNIIHILINGLALKYL